MVFYRHKCLLKIYIFILKILSFSFERTKENETKENSLRSETSPHTLRRTVGTQQGIAKRYFLIDFCSTYYLETAFLHRFAPLLIDFLLILN